MSDISTLVSAGAVVSALVSVVATCIAVLAKPKGKRTRTIDTAPENIDTLILRSGLEGIDKIHLEKLSVMISELKIYHTQDEALLEKIQSELARIQRDARDSIKSKRESGASGSDA